VATEAIPSFRQTAQFAPHPSMNSNSPVCRARTRTAQDLAAPLVRAFWLLHKKKDQLRGRKKSFKLSERAALGTPRLTTHNDYTSVSNWT